MVELRTKQEIQRDKLHETICGQYNEFRQLMPNATPTRIFTAIAQLPRHDLNGRAQNHYPKRALFARKVNDNKRLQQHGKILFNRNIRHGYPYRRLCYRNGRGRFHQWLRVLGFHHRRLRPGYHSEPRGDIRRNQST